MATRWQEGVCWPWRQAGSSPVEENTAAMPCWAQRRLESQSTVSTSFCSKDPSDIILPGLQPLPIAHAGSARTDTVHSEHQHPHTNEQSTRNTLKLAPIHARNRGSCNKQDSSDNIRPLCWDSYASFLHISNKMDAESLLIHLSSPKPQTEDGHEKSSVCPASPPSATGLLLRSPRPAEEDRKRMEDMLQRMLIQRRDFFL